MQPTPLSTVATPDGLLAYRVDGAERPGEIPLLILQRFRGTMDDWDPALILSLSASRQVIRFDSAGVGRSGGTTPDTVEAMALIGEAFLRALGVPKVDILGWSLGGFIAQHMALNAPDLVGKLVIAGSGPGAADGPAPHSKVPEIATKSENSDEDFQFLFFTDTPAGRDAGRAHLGRLKAQNAIGPLATMASVMQQAKALAQWSGSQGTRLRLSELAMPMLVANGVSDIMVPAFQSYVIAQEAPDAKLILYPDSGHAFLFQYAEAFSADVGRFLDSAEVSA